MQLSCIWNRISVVHVLVIEQFFALSSTANSKLRKEIEMALLVEDYKTINELAQIKGVSLNTMRQYIKNHREIPRKKVGKSYVIRLSDLKDYIPMSQRW